MRATPPAPPSITAASPECHAWRITPVKPHSPVPFVLAALLACPAAALAADAAPLQVPAKTLPVPTADISPEMQKFVGAPLNPIWHDLWKTGEEWRGAAAQKAAPTGGGDPAQPPPPPRHKHAR